jgi:DNA (cytosine-5)-methyltransferase 1
MTFGSLFAGIGGFDLGLERSGMECKWQVEIDPFCQKVLAKHWPGVKRYGDIREVGKHNLEPVDLICGGFPCQPFSCAGKRGGKEDNRYLWPEMLRVISEVRPAWVIGENVAGIVNMELDQVCIDLENEGYEVKPFIIPACAINAPHRRDRVWIVAHSRRFGSTEHEQQTTRVEQSDSHAPYSPPRQDDYRDRRGLDQAATSWEGGNPAIGAGNQYASDPQGITFRSGLCPDEPDGIWRGRLGNENSENASDSRLWKKHWLEVATRLCRVDDGLPRGVDRVNRLKALGNSVVPEIVRILGAMIMEVKR